MKNQLLKMIRKPNIIPLPFIILAVLIVGNSCNSFVYRQQPEIELQSQDIIEALKCLVDKATPLVPEVLQLVEAIKAQDFITIISLAQKLYQEGQAAYLACFENEVFLQSAIKKFPFDVDFECLQSCVVNVVDGVKACKPLVQALVKKDFDEALKHLNSCVSAVPKVYSVCQKCIKIRN